MQELRAAGHAVMLVGGAVRDLLIGCRPKDYDLLTSAHIAEVKQLLPRPRVFGRHFPICQLHVEGVRIEVSSMHTLPPVRLQAAGAAGAAAAGAGGRAVVPPDAAQMLDKGPKEAVAAAMAAAKAAGAQIGRHRHCKAAGTQRQQQQQHLAALAAQQARQRPPTWAAARRENALGRDFTANCLLYDPFAGLLFDYVGGVADLQARLLRCNGDAAARFSRDPACMLRAVRCAARAGLQIEPQTLAAMQQQGHLASGLNSQRLTAELLSLLGYGAAAPSMQLLQETQLLQHVLPVHAAYMQRQQQGQQEQPPPSSTSRAAAQVPATADGGQAGSCRGQSAAVEALVQQQQQQQQQDAGWPPQAASALGQLWLGQQHHSTGSPQRTVQRQQVQELQEQHQQLQHSNMLLRVLAALDQHVSVSQPAAPEVVLACLTAPLLLEALAAAVTQLQHHVQKQSQQQQQTTQQLAALQHVLQQQRQQQQDQRQSAGEHYEAWQVQFAAAQAHSQPSDTLTLVLQPVPVARNIARHFSSSSSSSSAAPADGGAHCPVQDSTGLATQAGQKVVQQLLQGVAVCECIQQQGIDIAAQVCLQPASPEPAQEQQAYQASCSGHLFGANAPKLAAELLLRHLRLSQQQQQQSPQPSVTAGPTSQQQPRRRSGRSARKSSSAQSGRQQPSAVQDLWDEYAAALPRSNKQFMRLMQQQWGQQLPSDAEAGYVGSLATDAMLADAAAAAGALQGRAARSWLGSVGGVDSCSEDDEDEGDAGSAAGEVLLHQVLQAAGVDLVGLQQQLQALQRQCSQPAQAVRQV